MSDVKKMKSRVVVAGESSRRVEGSGAAPDVGVSLDDQFPLISSLYVMLLWVKRREGEWKTRAERLTTCPEVTSVGAPLSIVGGCESEGVTLVEAVGRAGLISETETALDTAGLPIC